MRNVDVSAMVCSVVCRPLAVQNLRVEEEVEGGENVEEDGGDEDLSEHVARSSSPVILIV